MKDKLTTEQIKLVLRLAGGNLESSTLIRSAAHRIVISAASESDYETVINYINEPTNIILAK